jgi:hypothetical protein
MALSVHCDRGRTWCSCAPPFHFHAWIQPHSLLPLSLLFVLLQLVTPRRHFLSSSRCPFLSPSTCKRSFARGAWAGAANPHLWSTMPLPCTLPTASDVFGYVLWARSHHACTVVHSGNCWGSCHLALVRASWTIYSHVPASSDSGEIDR